MRKKLIDEISYLKNQIGKDIEKRLKGFKKPNDLNQIFVELCFCILVANNSVETTKRIWNKIMPNFLNLSEEELRSALKSLGYRYYNKRAEYIINAREQKDNLPSIFKFSEKEGRRWLAKNIKGIGFKEASHFLRNMGYKNLAILDRHVLRILLDYGIIDEIPKTLTEKKYIEIENKLKGIASELNISLSELDLYLFYLKTRRICEK